MNVITRFAPSPTGFLHIGGARTALFNWLFAKHMGGIFYLRIEDTDALRSTNAAKEAIISGMRWLGLDWDHSPISSDGIVYQSGRQKRHEEIAHLLLDKDKAYYCYTPLEEVAAFRTSHPGKKFQSLWRDKNKRDAPKGIKPAIRLKAPQEGITAIEDAVRGKVEIRNTELDDMVILRADGTPTYMLAVVVDDFDMGVNHILRGDDHFTNTFRQYQIMAAMDWPIPKYAHIPLIHGVDGAKLSKRHGALGLEAYREMGYLPESMRNYLLRLGWSHHNEEIISTARAIEIFNLESLGKSPARFDIDKLNHINSHYISQSDDASLLDLIGQYVEDYATQHGRQIDEIRSMLLRAMPQLKIRANTIIDVFESSKVYIAKKTPPDDQANELLLKTGVVLLQELLPIITELKEWNHSNLDKICREFAEQKNYKLAPIMQSLRAGVLGISNSPSIFAVLDVLGREETLRRLLPYHDS